MEIKQTVEIVLLDMKDSHPTKIKIGDSIFVRQVEKTEAVIPKTPKQETLIPKKVVTRAKNKTNIVKGKKVDMYGSSVGIFENVLNDIKDNPEKINSVLTQYHPNVQPSTIDTYRTAYLYVINKEQKNIAAKPGAIGFSKTYNVYPTAEDVKKVTRAITHVELGYTPTRESIVKHSSLPVNRVNGTLDVMKKTNIVKRKRLDDGSYIFKLIQ